MFFEEKKFHLERPDRPEIDKEKGGKLRSSPVQRHRESPVTACIIFPCTSDFPCPCDSGEAIADLPWFSAVTQKITRLTDFPKHLAGLRPRGGRQQESHLAGLEPLPGKARPWGCERNPIASAREMGWQGENGSPSMLQPHRPCLQVPGHPRPRTQKQTLAGRSVIFLHQTAGQSPTHI